MNSKKDSLVKALANLVANHSASDWNHAANRLEDIARLARSIAEINLPKPKKGKKAVGSGSRNRRTKNGSLASNVLQYEEQLPFLGLQISKVPITRLRDLAVAIGMKDELQKTKDGIVLQIYRHLERIDKELLPDRLSKLSMALSEETSSQEDYSRWVKLITKKPLSD